MKFNILRCSITIGLIAALASILAINRLARPTPFETPDDAAQLKSASANPIADSDRLDNAPVAAAAARQPAAGPGAAAAMAEAARAFPSTVSLWSAPIETRGAALVMNPAVSPSHDARGATKGRSARIDAASVPPFATWQPGTLVALPLFDGDQAIGRVKLVQAEGGDIVRIGGQLEGSRQGSFVLGSQGGKVDGAILLAGEGIALVIAKQEDGTTTLEEKPIGEVICTPMPNTGAVDASAGGQGIEISAITVPALSSRPTATAVIYLDFDGETVTDPRWNGGQTIVAAPANVTVENINQIWASVKEDYWMFNVDVTTDLNRYLTAPVSRRTRCIITPTDTAAPGSGGVSYVNTFRRAGTGSFSATLPSWVFVGGAKAIAEAASHEVGHTMGLLHDGRTGEPYYAGHGSGAVGWAPIMGVGYYRSLVQWSKGEYPNASNTEDDLAIISSTTNGFGYVADEAGGTRASAALLGVVGNTIGQAGIVSNAADVDYFSVALPGGGTVSLSANPAAVAPDLDIFLGIEDASGAVLATNNPDLALNASLSLLLGPGIYYVRVQGAGRGSVAGDGYSSYGSIGAYTLTGTISGVPQAPLIGGIPNQNLLAGTPSAPIAVLVSDADTNVNLLTLSATSSNQSAVPNAGISLGGSGAARSIILIPTALAGTTTITVTVSDGALSNSTSFVATVTAPTSLPAFALNPASQTVTVGDAVTFVAAASGTPAPTYQWRKNGSPIAGATGATFVIASAALGDAGNYSVTASNPVGTATSSVATLTVNNATSVSPLLAGTTIGTAPYANYVGYEGAKAFDGDAGTFFAGRPGDAFVYVGRDFGSAKMVDRVRYLPRGGYNWRMTGGRFRGANLPDLSDAVTLHTIALTPPEGVWQDVTLPASGTGYRYVFFTTISANEANVAELEFFGSSVAPAANFESNFAGAFSLSEFPRQAAGADAGREGSPSPGGAFDPALDPSSAGAHGAEHAGDAARLAEPLPWLPVDFAESESTASDTVALNVGVVIAGAAPKRVLLRGEYWPLGADDSLIAGHRKILVYRGDQLVAAGDGVDESVALVVVLEPGSYLVQLVDSSGSTGRFSLHRFDLP